MRDYLADPVKGPERRAKDAAHSRAWRQKNPEKHKAGQKRAYAALRLECFRRYSGLETPACRCCGETMLEFLHIDHVKGDGAEFRAKFPHKYGGTRFYYWLKKQGFPDLGLQVLCANCNLGKRCGIFCPHELQRGVSLAGDKISDELRARFAGTRP